jgi:hypothetical protein
MYFILNAAEYKDETDKHWSKIKTLNTSAAVFA